jgi:methylglutaconyl-CoA hydratase
MARSPFERRNGQFREWWISFEAGLDFERASYEPLLHSKDRLEVLEAFKAKRPPQFKGE